MKRVAVFIGCLLMFAGLAWIAGFNFDQSGFSVAWWTFVAIVFSALATTIY